MKNNLSCEETSHFVERFGMPSFIVPWLDRFYEPAEIAWILTFCPASTSNPNIKEPVAANSAHARTPASEFLARCHRRAVAVIDTEGKYVPAGFHKRYEIWALFEGWQDIPDEIRMRLNQWELEYFVETKQPLIQDYQNTGIRDHSVIWPEYVLLDEALALLDRVPNIYLWPCNCRAMMKACSKPEFVCLRFQNNLDLGWEISKQRAKDIMLAAHKKGLMQSAEIGIAADGSIHGAICNCCSDCCYPVQLANHLNIAGLYPLRRYIAEFNVEKCTTCGRCVKRCPFQVFSLVPSLSDDNEKPKKKIHFNADLCRGCGLCSTTCPDDAIAMQALEPSPLSILSEI
jgi:ferredoxin